MLPAFTRIVRKKAASVYSSIRLYLKEEEKCWRLRSKYRLWKSQAFEKHGASGEGSREQHLG
jgi:hypothetical protein